MPLSDYQKAVNKWVKDTGYEYWRPLEILARITEETGELARIINSEFGPKTKKPGETNQELGEEMADIIWALCCLANEQDINLDNAFQKVVNKAYSRDSARFKKQGPS